MTITNSSVCPHCHHENTDLQHFFYDCSAFYPQRNILFKELQTIAETNNSRTSPRDRNAIDSVAVADYPSDSRRIQDTDAACGGGGGGGQLDDLRVLGTTQTHAAWTRSQRGSPRLQAPPPPPPRAV
ncbi:hypothetical protein ACJJTC_015268 [Scirpophaga incertulas]